MGECQFRISEMSECGLETLPDSSYCCKHKGLKCEYCGSQVTHFCKECNVKLCDEPYCTMSHNIESKHSRITMGS